MRGNWGVFGGFFMNFFSAVKGRVCAPKSGVAVCATCCQSSFSSGFSFRLLIAVARTYRQLRFVIFPIKTRLF
jgi:hypothetical protein